MKYLVLILICFASIQINAQNVLIRGSILNFHNQMQVEDLSEIGALNLPVLIMKHEFK
jgi:hypothetical protein